MQRFEVADLSLRRRLRGLGQRRRVLGLVVMPATPRPERLAKIIKVRAGWWRGGGK
jgi:hypothetical protein